MLVGRDHERAEIDRLLREARDGAGRCLVLRGEAGIGKTALLGYAARSADGFTVRRLVGVESESGMPFAALHLLVGGSSLAALPVRQRTALEQAVRGEPADALHVGLAVLSLLDAGGPALVPVDDVEWVGRPPSRGPHFPPPGRGEPLRAFPG